MLRAVIFDMDDTLICWPDDGLDWETLEREHLRRVFDYIAREIHPPLDFERLVSTMRDRSLTAWNEARETFVAPSLGTELVAALTACGVPADRIDLRACLNAYGWDALPGTAAYPEAPAVLRDLRQRGLRLGLLTNAYAPMWMRDRELNGVGLSPDLFLARVSTADVGYLKPHPAAFQAVLDELAVTAEDAVFVGDNLHADIGGAQNVGMKAILRVGEAGAQPYLDAAGPDAIVRSLTELPAILAAWFPDTPGLAPG
jgi:putative hydrolase of the HAD superfamily